MSDEVQPESLTGLLKHLVCVVCLEVKKGHILHCSNEHHVCEECFNRLPVKRCPCCNVFYPRAPQRSRTIEAMVADLGLEDECPNKESGCDFKTRVEGV